MSSIDDLFFDEEELKPTFTKKELEVIVCPLQATFVIGWKGKEQYKLIANKIKCLLENEYVEYPEQILVVIDNKDKELFQTTLIEVGGRYRQEKINYSTIHQLKEKFTHKVEKDNKRIVRHLGIAKVYKVLFFVNFSKIDMPNFPWISALVRAVFPFFFQEEEFENSNYRKRIEKYQLFENKENEIIFDQRPSINEWEKERPPYARINDYKRNIDQRSFKSPKITFINCYEHIETCKLIDEKIREHENKNLSYLVLITKPFHEEEIYKNCFQWKDYDERRLIKIKRLVWLIVDSVLQRRLVYINRNIRKVFFDSEAFEKIAEREWSVFQGFVNLVGACKKEKDPIKIKNLITEWLEKRGMEESETKEIINYFPNIYTDDYFFKVQKELSRKCIVMSAENEPTETYDCLHVILDNYKKKERIFKFLKLAKTEIFIYGTGLIEKDSLFSKMKN